MRLQGWRGLRDWHQFGGEVGVIVIGVLIALGAEYSVQQWHWRNQADIAGEAIKEELLNAALWSYERQAVQPCLRGRIEELAAQLGRGERAWSASPLRRKNQGTKVLPVAYAAPSRNLPTDAWQNAMATGTLDHLPRQRVQSLSGLYAQVEHWTRLQEDEARAASKLAALAIDGQLDADGRIGMIGALAEVDRINALMALISTQMQEEIRSYGLGFPKAENAKRAGDLVAMQRADRGTCVAKPAFDLG